MAKYFDNYIPPTDLHYFMWDKMSDRNENILNDWVDGVSQKDLSNIYGIGKTRIRQILSKYKRLLPEDKRI